MRLWSPSLFLALPLLFGGCDVGVIDGGLPSADNPGGGGDEGGDDVEAPDAAPIIREYSVTLDPPLGEIELGQDHLLTARVTSDNYEGPVTLLLQGALPPTWDFAFEPSESFEIGLDETVDVTLRISVPSNGDAAVGHPIDLSLDGALGSRQASAALTVANRFTVTIAQGTGGGGHGFGNILIRQGTELVILDDDDNAQHRIHAEPHQEGNMNKGDSYKLVYNSPGQESAYCHIHEPNTGVLNIGVEKLPEN